MAKREKGRGKSPTPRRVRGAPAAESPKETAAVPATGESPPVIELAGLLDDVKATVIALLASLQEKERDLRKQLRSDATPGVKTGLADIRLLRGWADRTLGTIERLERGNYEGLQPLLEELGEFSDLVHAHDVGEPVIGTERP
ncbi:MAG: hypothetical protein ACREQQ_13830 [Candidatus Binatia bacterium]